MRAFFLGFLFLGSCQNRLSFLGFVIRWRSAGQWYRSKKRIMDVTVVAGRLRDRTDSRIPIQGEPGIVHYVFLLIAVALEVCGTMLLPVSQNFTRPVPTLSLIGCYAASFYCLTFALNTLPIAVVYATWSGLGIFLITVFGYLVFEQALDWRAIVGLLLIVAGVVLVNSFAPHK